MPRKMKININHVVKVLLILIPILVAAFIILYLIDGNTIPFENSMAILTAFGCFLNVFYTISYFWEIKYYTKKSRQYKFLWIMWGVLSLGAVSALYFVFHSDVIFFIGPVVLISFLMGAMQLLKIARKYEELD